MNLDELQIKISIELDDLNKQLKSITKGIDEVLGPKATKKLMADNNKVIKSGLTSINKTTLNLVKKSRKDTTKEVEAMSKDINKSLNKAFDINLTKFNSNITSAMNQARQTVRSACNDIRRELNAALNIQGNIRVTSKTTVSGSATGSSGSNVASNMASSQYIGAMIIKSTNAVIANNNANTTRLEQAINGLAGKLASAIRKINITTTPVSSNTVSPNNIAQIQTSKTGIKPEKKPQSREKDTLERNKAPLDIGLKEEIAKAKELLKNAREFIAKAYLNGTDIKKPGSSQSSNSLLEGGRVNFTMPGEIIEPNAVPVEAFKQIQDIIEVINYETKDFETALVNVGNRAVSVAKTLKDLKQTTKGTETLTGEVITPQVVDLPTTQFEKVKEVIEDATYRVLDFEKALMNTSNFDLVGEGFIDDSQVKALKQVHELMQKIKATPLGLNAPDGSNSQADLSQLSDIKAKIKQIEEQYNSLFSDLEFYHQFSIIDEEFEETLGSIKKLTPGFEQLISKLNEIGKEIEEEKKFSIDTSKAESEIKRLKDLCESTIEDINNGDILDGFRRAQDTYEPPSAGTTLDPNKAAKQQKEISRRTKTNSTKPPKPPTKRKDSDTSSGKPPKPTIMGFGFGAYKNEIDTLIEYAKKAGAKIKEALYNSDSQTLGFAPYQNELHELGETAKRIGAKIKNAFGKVGSEIKGIFRGTGTNLLGDFGNSFDSHVAVQQAGEFKNKFKEQLGEIKNSFKKMKDSFKKTASTIGKLASKITAPFKKVASTLKNVASSTKSAWSKITGIFKKGATEAANATNKLTLSLKDLLKQALGFVSIYGMINLGREAITQSQELAQSEIKLASLMKQRMGATNDTVLAIRQLAEEQAKLGVVSETAMKTGAQQLARYVHSAKALKELMPAIANLTAARGGVMATPDDAEEIATQLGEAIREGTTTPLEQSGIYLSEKEIEKFAELKTEEERAAYLASVVAQEVGNINEALAKTPHGQIAQLKNNFQSLLGTLGIFLANVLQPIVQWLNVIVVACNKALKAFGELLGFDMTGGTLDIGDLGTGSTDVDTGGVEDATDSLEDATDAAEDAEEAVEKFKGSLMGFDELNILTDNTNKKKEKDDPTDITPGEGGQLVPEVGELTEGESIFGKFGDKIKAFMDEIIEPFKNAWALLGDRWKAEWADLVESFKHFCDSLAKFLKSVWEHGKRFSAVSKPRKIGRTLIII